MLHLAELSFHKLNTLLNFDKQIKSNQRCSGKQVPDEGYWKIISPSPGIRHGVEVFHIIMNTFAPGSTHLFYPAVLAKLFVIKKSSKTVKIFSILFYDSKLNQIFGQKYKKNSFQTECFSPLFKQNEIETGLSLRRRNCYE